MIYEPLRRFALERESIRLKRLAGEPAPWTPDKILSSYRFTNVRRFDDRVTQWLYTHWLLPYKALPDVWFTAVVGRYFNNVEVLEAIDNPFNLSHMKRVLDDRRARGKSVQGNAYMIRPSPLPGVNTVDFLIHAIFEPMLEDREGFRPVADEPLAAYHEHFTRVPYIGSFMAQQIVADVAYIHPFPDHHTFSAPGPGSMGFLNLVFEGYKPSRVWKIQDFQAAVRDAQHYLNTTAFKANPLIAMDVTNCMCETFKYLLAERQIRNPRRLFTGK